MAAAELPKAYDPEAAQRRWYGLWVERGYFTADPDSERAPYSIVIPPPNVTGALHLGHALNNTIQDILIRWRRMQGFDCLWMPGTDHAGIATQAVVERRVFEEERKTRHDLGREGLVGRIWEWKAEYEARILAQLRQMGCSCDWTRTRFTLDEGCTRAVRHTFFRLIRAGKIFRGKRLVNWDTQLRTAVADDEITHEEIQGWLWTIRYPLRDSPGEFLRVATTRPETMLGDTAVAVHPEDPRYARLIGKAVTLPLLGREIPIIGDGELVDPRFGTGCVKVTPAHDPNDYAAGLRNDLPQINLLNPDGTYNENAGVYAGLDRFVVRKRVVADLEAAGLLEKVEGHLNRVGHSDRSKTPIEPYLSDQWFVRMGDEADGSPGFAQRAIDAVESGRIGIHPDRYAKSYIDWLAEKRDWCISRQLWWGHRIPVWTKRVVIEGAGRREAIRALIECGGAGGEEFSRLTEGLWGDVRAAFADEAGVHLEIREWGGECESAVLQVCVDYGREEVERRLGGEFGFAQDPDVLDTWFSSALWPHSTMGWPGLTPEILRYYPTNVLSTARDIISLWVARMVIFGEFNMSEIPFRDVYIHPVIQDGQGRRMSKSLGNGVDPADIIEIYGADALRFTLAAGAGETQDLRMPVVALERPDGRRINTSERFEQGRNFANKFWNAARFAMMNLEGWQETAEPREFAIEDRWIRARLDATIDEATAALESFRFADLSKLLRDFTWNDFCDWYLEFIKQRLRDEETRPAAQATLAYVLDRLCRLLHPIMPFVTEQVWQAFGEVAKRGVAESVCIAAWPLPDGEIPGAAEALSIVGQWQEKIAALRGIRADQNIGSAAKIAPIIVADEAVALALRHGESIICGAVNASRITIGAGGGEIKNAARKVLADAEIIVPLDGLIDFEAEEARHRKAIADIERQLASVRAKLGNESFVARAPADVVSAQREKEQELVAQRASIETLLAELQSRS